MVKYNTHSSLLITMIMAINNHYMFLKHYENIKTSFKKLGIIHQHFSNSIKNLNKFTLKYFTGYSCHFGLQSL